MKTRVLLIDSDNLLKRSFHGAKDVYTSSFGHLGGLYSFMTTARMLIKEHKINKVVLFWDGEAGGIMRHRIDKEYKANRKHKEWYKKIEMTAAEIRKEREKEQSILKQRIRIHAYAEELFIRQIEVDNIESDDLIASYCLRYNNKEEIFLYSNDRDFAQLLDLNITIIFPNIKQPVTRSNYIMHFNHHYTNALVMKIICGDDVDNIAGIEGIGENTLLKLFPEMKFKHVTVREICKKADEINQNRILEKKKPLKSLENLLTHVGRLKKNFELVNLRKPMLNETAENELLQLELPLSPDDRGSKNLMKLMMEDEFLTIYKSTFVQYVEPFYTVIMYEKQLLMEYRKQMKNNL
jgi:5'-3' exonuclease